MPEDSTRMTRVNRCKGIALDMIHTNTYVELVFRKKRLKSDLLLRIQMFLWMVPIGHSLRAELYKSLSRAPTKDLTTQLPKYKL